MKPRTRYARAGDVYVGYQVFGEGPFDLVAVPGGLTNIEYAWEFAGWREYYGGLATFSRVLLFDKRGMGVSDPVVGAPSLEERMDDVRAVMDAAGSERAALVGAGDGAAMVALFAATYPDRTAALVLSNPVVRGAWAPDFPWGASEEEQSDPFRGTSHASPEHVAATVAAVAPSRIGDEAFAQQLETNLRLSASPTTRANLLDLNRAIDVRHALGTIRAPTLVMHRDVPEPAGRPDSAGGPLLTSAESSRYVADRIPGARFLALPLGDYAVLSGDIDAYLTGVRDFLTSTWEAGAWEPADADRVLSTLLFTDIVDASRHLTELGDAGWRDLLGSHHGLVRGQLARFRGREHDTAGDGFFASFDGPARAIRCACAIRAGVRELGLEVRAGLHTGECELIDGKMGGIAVHIAARVAADAGPGEVLVSRTVKDLVAGSGLEFHERGTHQLKGISGKWELFAARS